MKKIISVFLALLFLAACTTSNNVASNKLLQKRKYKKGWHVNSNQTVEKSTKSENEELAVTTNANSENKEESTASVNQESESTETETTVAEEEVANENESETSEKIKRSKVKEKVKKVTDKLTEKSESFVAKVERGSQTINQKLEESKDSSSNSNSNSDVPLILLVILAFIVPPVAVGLVRGWDSQEFLISLALFLIAIGLAAFIGGGLIGLAALLGLVYALLIIFDVM